MGAAPCLPLIGITLPAISTGVIGLGLYYAAYIAEAYRGAIDGGMASGKPPRRWTRPPDHMAPDHPAPGAQPMLPILGNYLIGMFKETPLLAVITIPGVVPGGQASGRHDSTATTNPIP